MPNDRHWSASMALEWVLTRDIDAVPSMADRYGACRVDPQGVARIQPFTLDDVARTHSIDERLLEEKRAREAVRRATSSILPARKEIFDALRTGTLDSWARPNGSGGMTRIEPIQWAGLRFCAFDGHDIALPVDSEGEPLSLPQPLTDYLTGAVPSSSDPTVWPDPVFLAEQAQRLWPKHAPNGDHRPGGSGGPVAGTADATSKPSEARSRVAPALVTLVDTIIKVRGWPGREVRCKVFYDAVRFECVTKKMRKYSDRHIARAVAVIKVDPSMSITQRSVAIGD